MNSAERVLKHPLASRIFHWGLILGFLPAAITGFIIWLKPGGEDFVNIAMKVHITGAVILTISCILYTIFAMPQVVAFIRRSFTYDKNDFEWFKVGGGYPQKIFLKKKIPVPPMGKINSGQKTFGLSILPGGIMLILTGWILYAFIPFAPKAIIYWVNMAHLLVGIGLGLYMFAHIFLEIYNWEDCKAMFGDGTVPLEYAKEHNPLWVENEIESVNDNISAKKNVTA